MLHEAIQFAKEQMPITRKNIEVGFHAQKSVSYNDWELLVKKKGGSFDVTVGAHHVAEVCELLLALICYVLQEKSTIQKISDHAEMTD